MIRFYVLLGIGLIIGGCSTLPDSEIIVRASPPKKPIKPIYIPPEEKPLDSLPEGKTSVPIAPQVGIRIPLEK